MQKQEIAELKEKLASNNIPRSASAILEDKTKHKTPAKEIAVKKTDSKISPDKKSKSGAMSSITKPGSKKLSPAGRKSSPLNKKPNLIERMTPLGTSGKVEDNITSEEKREVPEDKTQKTEHIEESKAVPEVDEVIAAEPVIADEKTQELIGGRERARVKAAAMMNRAKSGLPEQIDIIPKATNNETESFNLTQENLEADVIVQEEDNKSKETAIKKSSDSKLFGYMVPVKFKTFEKLTRIQKVNTATTKNDSHRKLNPAKSSNNKSGVSSKQKRSPNTAIKKNSELVTSSTVPQLRSVSASGHAHRS